MGLKISKLFGHTTIKVDPDKFSEIVPDNCAAPIIFSKRESVVTTTRGILWILRSGIHAFIVFEHLIQTETGKYKRNLNYFDFGPASTLAMIFGGKGKTKAQNEDGKEDKRFENIEVGPSWGNLQVDDTLAILQHIFNNPELATKYSSLETNSSGTTKKEEAKNCLSFIEKEVLRNPDLKLTDVDDVFKGFRWRVFAFPPKDISKMREAQDGRK